MDAFKRNIPMCLSITSTICSSHCVIHPADIGELTLYSRADQWLFSLLWLYVLKSYGFRIKAGTRDLSFVQNIYAEFGAHPVSYLIGIRGSSPGVNLSWQEADHRPLSRGEVENEWRYISSPPICLHGMYKDNIFVLLTGFVHSTWANDICWTSYSGRRKRISEW